jgi:hypothetical protein
MIYDQFNNSPEPITPSVPHSRLTVPAARFSLCVRFMKTRRLVILCALLGGLFASVVPSSADESKLTQLKTSLSNTTISGYLDSTTGGQVQPPAHQGHRDWWQALRLWLRLHGR